VAARVPLTPTQVRALAALHVYRRKHFAGHVNALAARHAVCVHC